MVCGARASNKANQGSLLAMTTDELRALVKKKHKKVELLSRMTRDVLCHMAVDMVSKNYLVNDGHNSCFLDSLLVALLAAQKSGNSWMHRHIWLAQPNKIWPNNPGLADLAGKIRVEIKKLLFPLDVKLNRHNAKDLRKMFEKFDTMYVQQVRSFSPRTEWLRTQNDPLDVIIELYRVFQIPDGAYAKLGKNTQSVSISTPMIDVFTLMGMGKKKVYLDEFVPINKNMEIEMLRAKIMYVTVQRNYMDERKIMTQVIPSKTVNLQLNKKVLRLSSALVHIGSSPTSGHYVAYICDHKTNMWYLYDDLQDHLRLIGDFDDLSKNKKITSNIVGLIYV
jgi:hypothetical protein